MVSVIGFTLWCYVPLLRHRRGVESCRAGEGNEHLKVEVECNLGNAYRSSVAGEVILWNYTLNVELNVAARDFPEHCPAPMTGVHL